MGRPRRAMSDIDKQAMLEAMQDGLPWHLAAESVGVGRQVAARTIQEDEGFAMLVQKTRAMFARETVRQLRGMAAGQWQKAAWQLERLFPDVFSLNAKLQVETTGSLQVTAAVCQQLAESWQAFNAKQADAVVVNDGDKPQKRRKLKD